MSLGDTTIKTRHPFHVDDPDPDFGLCAIHYAAKRGHIPVIKLLIQYGADVNIRAPDGRTALHFAAAYSNKETVRCLLAELADYYAVDDFKCTALDVAKQNDNRKTIPTLERWKNLTPSVDDEDQQNDEEETPAEFAETPAHVKQLMSPKLKILCSRLDGEERATSQGIVKIPGVLDPNILMRLCERHSLMCLEEGFDKEGIKTSLRRWRVCNNLHLSYKASMAELEMKKQLDADSQLMELVPHHNDVGQCTLPPPDIPSSFVKDANEQPQCSVNNVNMASSSSQLPMSANELSLPPSPVKLELQENEEPVQEIIAETFDDMFSDKGYIIPEGEEGDNIRLLGQAIIMRKNKKAALAAARAREALEAKRKNTSTNNDNVTNKMDHETEKQQGPNCLLATTKDQKDRDDLKNLGVQTELVVMTAKALCDVGRDVAERLVMDGQERFAMTVLLDCAVLDGLEPTTVIAILTRYVEIGLVVIDLYAHLLKGRLDYRGRGMKNAFEESFKEDLSIYTTADVFQQSTVVTYLNTLRRYKEGEKTAEKLNTQKVKKRVAKTQKVQAAR